MSGLAGQEFSGKSVEEATADGLRALGLRTEDAVIEVLNKGSRGLFGIGSEPAVVRIAPRSADAGTVPAMSAMHGQSAVVAPGTDATQTSEPMAIFGEEFLTEVTDLEVDDDGEIVLDATVVEEIVTGVAPAEQKSARGESEEVDAEVAAMGTEMLGDMVRLMGFHCTVTAAWHDADEITEERHLLLSVRGPEASGLIGRRGETLENIQYLLRLMVNQRMHRWLNIIVDIEEYRARRVEHLTHLAQRMAQQAVDSGRSQALEPMTPNERRIVHLVLRDDTRVFTESTGEGERRKVVIFPKR